MRNVDEAIQSAVQKMADRIHDRWGVTSLEQAWISMLVFPALGLPGYAILGGFAILEKEKPWNEYMEMAGVAAFLVLTMALGILSLSIPRIRMLQDKSRAWRSAWEVGRLPARPSLSLDCICPYTKFLACLAVVLMSAASMVSILDIPENFTAWMVFSAVLGWSAIVLGWSAWPLSLYLESCTPRPPTPPAARQDARVPAGVLPGTA